MIYHIKFQNAVFVFEIIIDQIVKMGYNMNT
jgi:hypothetical protein